ncbi:probable dihydroorotase [Rhynchosporium secalis]|uniref:dihydroorotase n=1 Tax=Rhynchosporium secalis TaxID=38038 RepID=A0A1E1LWJ9_RHYSE|nr:probable dihydroorotase [Rhynchosporium secalis]
MSSPLAKFDGLELPPAADFHVHLRDGPMMETVVPLIRAGGVNTVYVMPNLIPPLTSASDAMAYKNRIQQLEPDINIILTLYLHESITPAVVRGAKAQGIVGIKVYPAGVTTNSQSGVSSYEAFYPVFRAMEQCGMVLNLHGECPSDHAKNITILNAESKFLETLEGLHSMFPKLKIVLEHCTTKDAIETVNRCGPNVVGTITAHHLYLTIDDWADDAFNYCKPVAKWPTDREALIKAAIGGTGKFFLGSDSAPHDISAKKGSSGKTAAGVFTQPYLLPLVIDAFELAILRGVITAEEVTVDILKGFLGGHGRKFYGISDPSNEAVILSKGTEIIQQSFKGQGVEVVPFRRGQSTWSIRWK